MIITLNQLKALLNESRYDDVRNKYLRARFSPEELQFYEQIKNEDPIGLAWYDLPAEDNPYPGDAEKIQRAGHEIDWSLEYLRDGGYSFPYQNWTSKNSKDKYLDWMMHQVMHMGEPRDEVLATVREFEADKRVQPREIRHFKTLADLRAAIEGDAAKRLAKLKVSTDQYDRVYDDSDIIVIHPKTTEAAQKYGAGTRWCISATKSKNYFHSYSRTNNFYFVIKKKQSGNVTDKIAAQACEVLNATNWVLDNMQNEVDEAINAKIDELRRGVNDSNILNDPDVLNRFRRHLRNGVAEEIASTLGDLPPDITYWASDDTTIAPDEASMHIPPQVYQAIIAHFDANRDFDYDYYEEPPWV